MNSFRFPPISDDTEDDQPIGVDPGQIDIPQPAPGAQPAASPDKIDFSKYMVSPEDLAKTREDQANLARSGRIGDALSNSQSWGNFFLGKMNPHQDVSGYTKQLSDLDAKKIEDKQALLAQEKMKPELQMYARMQDPNSQETQMARGLGGTMVDSLKSSGFFKNNPDALNTLSQSLQNGNAYQIQNMIASSPFLKDIAQQSMADKRNDTMLNRLAATMGNTNVNKAQTSVNNDKILNTYIPRLDGAQKILNLIDAGQKGEFATNKAMLGQLNAEISRLENGTQSPGLHSAEKTEMNSLAANLRDIADSVTGDVSPVDLSKKFAQARGMVTDLGKSYYNQIDDRFNAIKAGALPDQMPIYDAKHKSMNYSYRGFAPQDQAGQERSASGSGLPGVSTSQAGAPVDPKISAYAKQYNLPYEQAQKILNQRGYGR